MSDDIFLVKYDPDWVRQFDEEAFRLREVLSSSLLVRIDHFGSTAIPGLTAKPIIDILVGVNSLEEARTEAVSPLESIGYAFWSHNPDPDHLFFAKGLPPAPRRGTALQCLEAGLSRSIFAGQRGLHSGEKRFHCRNYAESKALKTNLTSSPLRILFGSVNPTPLFYDKIK